MSVLDTFSEIQMLASELAQAGALAEIWIAIRAEGDSTDENAPFGDGPRENPYAVNTPESFANIMRTKALANTTIHLGPGIFRTRGANGNGYTVPELRVWRPQPGQKLIGAGMFSTVIQFVWDLSPVDGDAPGQRHNVIRSTDFLSSWEISDLTLDCNIQNAPFNPKARYSGSIVGTVAAGALTKVTTTVDFFPTGFRSQSR